MIFLSFAREAGGGHDAEHVRNRPFFFVDTVIDVLIRSSRGFYCCVEAEEAVSGAECGARHLRES